MIKYKEVLRQLVLYTIFMFLLTGNSCVNKPALKAYYSFEEADLEKLLSFKLNQSAVYRSNLAEEYEFKAGYVTKDYKTQITSEDASILLGTIPLPDRYWFYYDKQEVSSIYGELRYVLKRFPKDIKKAMDNEYKEYPSELVGQIYFYRWNAIENRTRIDINFNAETTTMIVDGVTHKDVFVIESGNSISGVAGETVNRIFYSMSSGLIGYDEIDGTEWRLVSN